MENKYKISITKAAENDLDEIYSYISNDLFSPNTAERLIDEIEGKILSLGEFPYRNAV